MSALERKIYVRCDTSEIGGSFPLKGPLFLEPNLLRAIVYTVYPLNVKFWLLEIRDIFTIERNGYVISDDPLTHHVWYHL